MLPHELESSCNVIKKFSGEKAFYQGQGSDSCLLNTEMTVFFCCEEGFGQCQSGLLKKRSLVQSGETSRLNISALLLTDRSNVCLWSKGNETKNNFFSLRMAASPLTNVLINLPHGKKEKNRHTSKYPSLVHIDISTYTNMSVVYQDLCI